MSHAQQGSAESVEIGDVHMVLRYITLMQDGSSVDLQIVSVEQLRAFARGNEHLKELIGTNPRAVCLISFLRSHNLRLQQSAAKLLRSISVNEKSREFLARNGVISVLIKTLGDTDDYTLKLAIIATIWNLSVSDKNKIAIIQEGALPLFVKILQSDLPKLKNEVVGALRNLSLIDENKSIIANDVTVRVLVDLLGSDMEKTQRNAAVTLKNLGASSEKIFKIIRREGATECLNQILAKNGIEFEEKSALPKEVIRTYFSDSIRWENLVLIRKVGEGKYGDVYKAKYNDYPVACKIIKKKLQEDAEATLEELKFMRRLNHPNVVQLIGACLDPLNRLVIVTEFLSRGNLKDLIMEVTNLSLRLRMGLDIASGLFWLHSHHIIHRDLKLANLLVDTDWTVKISDFGLSLDLKKGEICHSFKGNIKYSPPEILRARRDGSTVVYPYNEKTDVYAYGLILWELLSLKQLFPHIKGKEDLTRHVLNGERPRLSPDWPISIRDILESCWDENPVRRPSFGTILKNYSSMVVDLMCPDLLARRVCKKFWRERNDLLVHYDDFEKSLPESVKMLFRTKKTLAKCFSIILCDYYEDTVSFERFCEVIWWFGPMQPIGTFFRKIKTLVGMRAFHGIISEIKAAHLVTEHYSVTKVRCYLYRLNTEELGAIGLTYIDKDLRVCHQGIIHDAHTGWYKLDDLIFIDFPSLHRTCKERYKLKEYVPGNPYISIFNEK